jgi:hypothetical protein
VLDPLSTLTTAWKVDTYPSSSSTVALSGGIDIGDGADGAITISSNTNLNTDTVASGRSCADGGDAVNYAVTALTSTGTTSITLSSTPSSGCLNIGDEFMIINMQGSSTNFDSVGLYETHTISNVTGATISFSDYPLRHTYNGTTQKIMIQRIPNYTDVTVETGQTLTVNAWDGTKGGLLFFRADSTVTINGTIDVSGKGYRGGTENGGNEPRQAWQGESRSGPGIQSRNPNDGGGGGLTSGVACYYPGSGGAGYGTSGGNGTTGNCGSVGLGGGRYGTPDLQLLFLGAGGGGESNYGGYGGNGGGISVIATSELSSMGLINANGSNGSNTALGSGPGGGGAGGSTLLYANTLSIGTNGITSNGGAGGSDGGIYGDGGPGGSGRIAIYYAESLTGSSTPKAFTHKTTSLVRSGSSTSYQLDSGKSMVDSATVGLWRLDETGRHRGLS